MPKKYHKVALGGTFDRLHQGHEHLLSTAVNCSDNIMIGVTTQKLNQHKKLAQIIQSYEERCATLARHLNRLNIDASINIKPLNDPFGETITDPDIEAVVVSPMTLPGAKGINNLRQKKGFAPIAIEVTDMVKDLSGEYLSSTRIRQGLVSRKGYVYAKLFDKDIIFTKNQKERIREPQGVLIDPNHLSVQSLTAYTRIALIGDRVTQTFIDKNLPFNFACIDRRIERKAFDTNFRQSKPGTVLKAVNPPGLITVSAVKAIMEGLAHQTSLLEITGEEDLLGFPVALSLPLNSLMLYGQPGTGLVQIVITESTKEYFTQILIDN